MAIDTRLIAVLGVGYAPQTTANMGYNFDPDQAFENSIYGDYVPPTPQDPIVNEDGSVPFRRKFGTQTPEVTAKAWSNYSLFQPTIPEVVKLTPALTRILREEVVNPVEIPAFEPDVLPRVSVLTKPIEQKLTTNTLVLVPTAASSAPEVSHELAVNTVITRPKAGVETTAVDAYAAPLRVVLPPETVKNPSNEELISLIAWL